MKRSLLLLLLVPFLYSITLAQDPDTFYLDEDWELCTSELAVFYGISHLDSLGNGRTDMFFLGGELFSIEPIQGGLRHGVCQWWHRNGNLAVVANYRHGLKHGKIEFWYPNGTKSSEGEYSYDEYAGDWRYWDSAGREYYYPADVDSPPLWGEQPDLEQSLGLLSDIVSDELDYPVAVRLTMEESVVTAGPVVELSVIVYTNGTLKVTSSVYALSNQLRSQIVRVLEYLDGWTPGEKSGEKVNTKLTMRMAVEAIEQD